MRHTHSDTTLSLQIILKDFIINYTHLYEKNLQNAVSFADYDIALFHYEICAVCEKSWPTPNNFSGGIIAVFHSIIHVSKSNEQPTPQSPLEGNAEVSHHTIHACL